MSVSISLLRLILGNVVERCFALKICNIRIGTFLNEIRDKVKGFIIKDHKREHNEGTALLILSIDINIWLLQEPLDAPVMVL